MSWIYRSGAFRFSSVPSIFLSVGSLDALRVGVMSEDLVDPLCEEGHVDEDARLVGPGAASAMDAHSHNNPDLTVLTHEGTAVIPLLKERQTAHFPGYHRCLHLWQNESATQLHALCDGQHRQYL